jgi:Cu/Ag efflux pump CusA
VWVTISGDADYVEALADIGETVAGVQHVSGEVVTSSTETLQAVGALRSGVNRVTGNSLDVLTGLDHPLAVRLYGQDPAVLAEQAEKIRVLMAGVEGVVNPVVEQPATEPTIEIEVDLEKAQQVGITPGAVRRAEATLLQGIQVGSVFEEQKVFDVVVQGAPSTREDVADIRNMLIDRPGGGHVRIGDVADVRVVQTPSVISREAVSRRLDVVAGVYGRGVADVAGALEAEIAAMSFPLEYHAEVRTPSTGDEIGIGRVVGSAVGALIAVLLLLQAAFRSWRLALVGTVALALALSGGLVTSLVNGRVLTLGSLLSFLAVFGLAARMVVPMVQALQAAEQTGQGRTGAGLASAAGSRAAPVVATTVALALLVLPAAVLGPRAGLELLSPMAVILLGGVVTTMLVTLFWVPAAYRHFAPPPERLVADDHRTSSMNGHGNGQRHDAQGNGQQHEDQGNGWHRPEHQHSQTTAGEGRS